MEHKDDHPIRRPHPLHTLKLSLDLSPKASPTAHLASSPASFLACPYCSATVSPVDTHSPRPLPPTTAAPRLVPLPALLLRLSLLQTKPLRPAASPGAPSQQAEETPGGGGGGDEPTTSANDTPSYVVRAGAEKPPPRPPSEGYRDCVAQEGGRCEWRWPEFDADDGSDGTPLGSPVGDGAAAGFNKAWRFTTVNFVWRENGSGGGGTEGGMEV